MSGQLILIYIPFNEFVREQFPSCNKRLLCSQSNLQYPRLYHNNHTFCRLRTRQRGRHLVVDIFRSICNENVSKKLWNISLVVYFMICQHWSRWWSTCCLNVNPVHQSLLELPMCQYEETVPIDNRYILKCMRPQSFNQLGVFAS